MRNQEGHLLIQLTVVGDLKVKGFAGLNLEHFGDLRHINSGYLL